MSSAWNVLARLMLQSKRAQVNGGIEFTATTSIARGQLCEVDFATKTIRPSNGRKRAPNGDTQAVILERELREWKP